MNIALVTAAWLVFLLQAASLGVLLLLWQTARQVLAPGAGQATPEKRPQPEETGLPEDGTDPGAAVMPGAARAAEQVLSAAPGPVLNPPAPSPTEVALPRPPRHQEPWQAPVPAWTRSAAAMRAGVSPGHQRARVHAPLEPQGLVQTQDGIVRPARWAYQDRAPGVGELVLVREVGVGGPGGDLLTAIPDVP